MAHPARSAVRRPVPHLQRDRLGTYYFRLTVDGLTRRRSLGTKDIALATMRASKLNWEWSMTKRSGEPSVEDVIKSFERGDAREFDVVLPNGMRIEKIDSDEDAARAKRFIEDFDSIGPIAPEHRPLRPEYAHLAEPKPAIGSKRKFVASSETHLEEWGRGRKKGDKSVDDKRAVFAAFAAHAKNPDLAAVDQSLAVAFKRQLMAGKAERKRINAKLGHLSTFFKWAMDNGEADSNPFDRLRIAPPKGPAAPPVESYVHFTTEEIAAIFEPKAYEIYASGKPHYYWLPFLLLFTGARPNELAGLHVGQIRSEHGIDYFALKAAKNTNSIRKIPFHRIITESGFPAYVEERRKVGKAAQLFPLLQDGKNGYAKNISRRFNEVHLASLGFDDPNKRLYSLRATFITFMTERNANAAMIMALVGHFEQEALDLSSPHFQNYQQGMKRIAALKETIDMLDIELPMKF